MRPHPMMPTLIASYQVQPLCPVCDFAMEQFKHKDGRMIASCVNADCTRAGVEYAYHQPSVILDRI